MTEIAPQLPIDEHAPEISIPPVIQSLSRFYALINRGEDPSVEFADGYVASSERMILERYGFDPKSQRVREIVQATYILASPPDSTKVLNDVLFYRSTGLYRHEELAEIATTGLYPYDPFEAADRGAEDGIIFEDALLSALEHGRAFATLADFLISYVDDARLIERAVA